MACSGHLRSKVLLLYSNVPRHPFSSKQFSCLRQHDSNKSARKVYCYKCHVVSVRSQTKANFSKHFLLELPQHFNWCLLESSEAKQAPIRVWNKTEKKVNCGRIIFFSFGSKRKIGESLEIFGEILVHSHKSGKINFSLTHTPQGETGVWKIFLHHSPKKFLWQLWV